MGEIGEFSEFGEFYVRSQLQCTVHPDSSPFKIGSADSDLLQRSVFFLFFNQTNPYSSPSFVQTTEFELGRRELFMNMMTICTDEKFSIQNWHC